MIKSDIDNLPREEIDRAFKRQHTHEAQQKFTELVQKDLDTFRFIKTKEIAIETDAVKLSRVNPDMIIDVRKTKDSVCKLLLKI
jgi:hypothetical protein